MSGFELAISRRFDQQQHAARSEAAISYAREVALAQLPFSTRKLLRDQFERDSAAGFNAASRAFYAGVRDQVANAAAHSEGVRVARVEGRDRLEDYASDATVRGWAHRRSQEAGIIADRAPEPGYGWVDAEAALRNHCSRWGIEPPIQTGKSGVLRMIDGRWWRRRARRMLTQRIETRALDALRVHKRADLYVSDRNCGRWIDAQKRNADTLRVMELVSEHGDVVSLAEVAAGSISNPKVRRCELMVRVKGMEKAAKARGFVGLFITWTLPSRYHAVLSDSGQRNPKHEGATPRDGQTALQALWARVRAFFKRRQWPYWGLRVAEPHHDATPHWHMLFFVQESLAPEFVEVLRGYALLDSPDEPGAQQHRFTVERIDQGKGSAVAYVAKYISKNTDAKGVETDYEGIDAEGAASALRARAWASTHRIRQFQFFGAPPVGIWRELRRERDALTADRLTTLHVMPAQHQLELFERARACADDADYAGHVEAVGGFATPRDALRMRLWTADADTPNQYGETVGKVLRGVAMGALQLCTRAIKWIIRQKSEASLLLLPRTRVNNCTGQEKVTTGGEKPPTPIPPPGDWIPWNPGGEFCY